MVSLKKFANHNYISLLIGLFLFLSYSIYAFVQITNLNITIAKLEKKNEIIEMNNFYQSVSLEAIREIKGINIKNYSISKKEYLDIDGNDEYNKMLLILVGECGACFENELPLWNELKEKAYNKPQGMIVVNSTNNINMISRYKNNEILKFPIFQDKGDFHGWVNKYPMAQVLALEINKNGNVSDLHISFLNSPEYTENFVKRKLNMQKGINGYDKNN